MVVLVVIVAVIFGADRKDKARGTIKIGATMPLTGPLAYFGESYSTGAELAVDEINSQGGINGQKLQLVLSDNQEDPSNAIGDFRKFVDTEGIKIVLAPMTRPALALAPLADQEKVIVFSNTITDIGSEYAFKDFYSVQKLGEEMGDAIVSSGTEELCVFSIQTPDGQLVVDSLGKQLESRGSRVLLTEMMERSSLLDFRTPLSKVKESGCDGLYAFVFPNTIPTLLKQVKEMGLSNLNFYTVQAQEPSVMSSEGAEEILSEFPTALSSWFSVDTTKSSEYKTFRQAYLKKYGQEPKGDTAYSYDDIMLIAGALEECGDQDTECLRKKILETRNYPGVAGHLTFGGDPNAQRGIYLEKFTSEGWAPFEE